MLMRLLAPWVLLAAAAGLSTWLFGRPQAAAAQDGPWRSWVDPRSEGLFKKGALTYAFENAGAGASLVSLLVAGAVLLFDDPGKAAVFGVAAVLLAGLCWPLTARRPWLRLTPENLAWKAPERAGIQEMPWSDVESVHLAWHARVSAQVVINSRRSGQRPLRIKARHLNISPGALARLLQERAEAARLLRRAASSQVGRRA